MIEKLPPEILDTIISIYRESLKANRDLSGPEFATPTPTLPILATVSRRFQDAVERQTFAILRIDPEFEGFEDIMNLNRRSYIRYITFTMHIIRREDIREQDNREIGYDTYRDREARNQAFTTSLRRAWTFLHELDASHPVGVRL